MSALKTSKPSISVNGIVGKDLLSIIERVERVEEDKAGLGADIATIYAEAKGKGFDVKIIRMIVRRRKREKHELDEEQTLLDIYLSAIGAPDAITEDALLEFLVNALEPFVER